MKLVISTPCFGGQLFRNYAGALMQAKELAVAEGLLTECHILWQGSESLIPRARNRDAMYLLESGFDKLLSIDADIEFTYEDFKRIITSEKDIVGGIYPLKAFPVGGRPGGRLSRSGVKSADLDLSLAIRNPLSAA